MMDPQSPFLLFRAWYTNAQTLDPCASSMTLATVNEMGQPSARMVLLQECDYTRGVFIFYTHLESKKATDILTNPHVALCFYWKSLKRQVRIEGVAYSVSDEEADAFFASSPSSAQLVSWASPQSTIIKNRSDLEQNVALYAEKFGDHPISRPPHWSGFCVQPTSMEFWEERPFCLHERMLYTPSAFEDSGWSVTRLAP